MIASMRDSLRYVSMSGCKASPPCVVRPGGTWIVLSYAAGRFTFLQHTYADEEVSDPLRVARFWTLEQYESVDAPSGQSNPTVFAPPVKHYVYVIRRTQVEARN